MFNYTQPITSCFSALEREMTLTLILFLNVIRTTQGMEYLKIQLKRARVLKKLHTDSFWQGIQMVN